MRNKLLIINLMAISTVYAVQDIQIIGGNNTNTPKIAVINFAGDSTDDKNNVSHIIVNDLSITGEFTVIQYPDISSVESSVKYIISGQVNDDDSINYQLLYNDKSANTKDDLQQNISYKTDIRKAVHTISNNVYQKITNVKGIFTTKIAYVVTSNNNYKIIVSDYDGYNEKTIFSDRNPVTSLAWDNTGKLISYVTFESGKPVVYVQNLYEGKRYKVANFEGSNSSPAFTPDGNKLAVTLTKDYGSHIYLVNNHTFTKDSIAHNLMNYGTIDTEVSFAKNGSMVFTSNHDGGPQIFMSTINASKPTRLTVNLGKYNTTARFSHDASKITFINRNAGILKTYIMDLSTKVAYPISLQTSSDMAPSFAPNDKLILFGSNGNSIYISNTTGTIQTKLNQASGNGTIIDQSWANNF